uniref:Insulin-like growth factor-binding protein 7 n=1 Tax=Phallusia mammillata TaxID=59560 RepID=A0A6F9DF14_9ASCI|nr:insulin-like growth factor-binding protein 7 [Phallusia mammillata]
MAKETKIVLQRVMNNIFLFVLVLLHCNWSKATDETCVCPDVCPEVSCEHPEFVVKDDCKCCDVCLGLEGDICGGPTKIPCALSDHRHGFSCITDNEDVYGQCQCKHAKKGPMCGQDGITYNTKCDLQIASWLRKKRNGSKLRVVYGGECQKAPVLTRIPVNVANRTGERVYIACEAYGIPTPQILFRKVLLEDQNVFEEMPSDRLNIAVQIRGGPDKNKISAWVLVDPITGDDAGWYECLASNNRGSVSERSLLEVLH